MQRFHVLSSQGKNKKNALLMRGFSTTRNSPMSKKKSSSSSSSTESSNNSINEKNNSRSNTSNSVTNSSNSSSSDRSSNHGNNNNLRQGPRRIVVKRNPNDIRDSCGVPIITHPTTTTTTTTSSSKSSSSSTLSSSSSLPYLNASSLLHSKEYCTKSASASTSRSGTEAARRLLRGKREFISTIQPLLLQSQQQQQQQQQKDDNKQQHQYQPNQAFILQGHGVPVQLLQDHVDLADAVLGEAHATCSFQNHQGELFVDWMTLQSLKRDENRACPWPKVTTGAFFQNDYEHSMELYVTVMHRMARLLGKVYEGAVIRRWSAEFARGAWYRNMMTCSSSSSSSLDQKVMTMVQWRPIANGMNAPGHVCLRLQGIPSRPTTRRPVSLSFDVSFRKEESSE